MRCFSCKSPTVRADRDILPPAQTLRLRLRRLHALFQRFAQLSSSPFKKHLGIAHGFAICLRGCQTLDTWAKTALDVVLQAGTRVIAREVHFAAGNEKAAVDQINDAMRQIAREIRPIIGAAVFAQAPCDEDLG